MLQIVEGKKPVIAKVHGAAYAAGCQLVASCDLAYSTNDAKFATPGVNIGLFCSTPMVAVSRKVSRKKMMKMLLTGDPINSTNAKEIAEKGTEIINYWQGMDFGAPFNSGEDGGWSNCNLSLPAISFLSAATLLS